MQPASLWHEMQQRGGAGGALVPDDASGGGGAPGVAFTDYGLFADESEVSPKP